MMEDIEDLEPDELEEKLEEAGLSGIEFTRHFYKRARKRNIDAEKVKEEVRERNFVNVRPNNQSDKDFNFSFKVTVETENGLCEMPIYFNVPGHKLLVKSVWPR
jgi:hypothetical protein